MLNNKQILIKLYNQPYTFFKQYYNLFGIVNCASSDILEETLVSKAILDMPILSLFLIYPATLLNA